MKRIKPISYSEKLRDPRWQKKRLEILQRDDFACQYCGDAENTLNVHHKTYLNIIENPWDYPNEFLITLCEPCHKFESETIYQVSRYITNQLRLKFYSAGILEIAVSLGEMKNFHVPEVMASVIAWTLQNDSLMEELNERFFNELKNKKGNKNLDIVCKFFQTGKVPDEIYSYKKS